MKRWLNGRGVALAVFLGISLLVTGGLGWVTAEALRLEGEQSRDRAKAEFDLRLKRAMWQLDSRIWPVLAREEGRPYNHYTALYAPSAAFVVAGGKGNSPRTLQLVREGSVLEPSPLLSAELPPWMVLHFQTNMDDWQSPQLLSRDLGNALKAAWGKQAGNPDAAAHAIDDPELRLRCQTMDDLKKFTTPAWMCQQVEERTAPLTVADTLLVADQANAGTANQPLVAQQGPAVSGNSVANNSAYSGAQQAAGVQQGLNNPRNNDYNTRKDQLGRVYKDVQIRGEVETLEQAKRNAADNGYSWIAGSPATTGKFQEVTVKVGPMVPLWSMAGEEEPKHLIVARMVNIADQRLCQGVVLDWAKLRGELADAVRDEFPDAKFLPVRQLQEAKENYTMTALPVELDPGPIAATVLPPWTPLRSGLLLAWGASLLGLLAAGLGGLSLLALSERRIRFVSAVTHELRTPLTTLRLYLDMLAGGLVAPEQQNEYVQTLHGETDRLNRLVGNVLDFSRLENQRPRLARTTMPTAELLEQVRSTWRCRCQNTDKELVVEDRLGPDAAVTTDVQLVQQVLGNLVDNACKYSQGAEDRRISLRAERDKNGRLAFVVEDRGPGVPKTERRSVFRAFHRGRTADVTAGGVGLGLALAQRWTRLLGGRLVLENRPKGTGACFRLELPTRAG